MYSAAVAEARGHRVFEVGALCATFVLFAIAVARLAPSIDSVGELLGLAAVIAIGYLVADFATGVVHWLGDTVGDASWPVFGGAFIQPFRHHHVDPIDLTRHDFVELNGNNAIAGLPLLALATLYAPDAPYPCALVIAIVFFAMVTNQIHQWAHAPSPPRWVRALQRARLILSPEHHQRHHTAPFDRAYCITTGWMNPVLDRLLVFRALERIIEWIHPRLISAETAQRRAR